MSEHKSVEPPVIAVRDAVARALAEDLGPLGDLTAALVWPHDSVHAEFRARSGGVLAGRRCAEEVFAQLGAASELVWMASDGDELSPGQLIGHVEGPLAAVLTAERSALNFLCHLSGIATLTNAFVKAASARGHAKVWDTRKTLPGLRRNGASHASSRS